MRDFVPRWFSIGVYVLVGAHLATWIVVAVRGVSSSPDFWIRFTALVTLSAILLLVARATVDRRFSDFLGMHDRRLGIRFALGSLIGAQFMFGLRLFGEVSALSFEVERVTHLALSLMLVVAMLALVMTARHDTRGQERAVI
jgi:hypothetical protein